MICHNTPRRWKGFEITGRFTFLEIFKWIFDVWRDSRAGGEIFPQRSGRERRRAKKGFPPLISKRVRDRMPLISGPCKSPVRKERMFR